MAQFYDYRYRGDPGEFMARVSRFPNLSAEEELALIARCQAGPDEEAMNHLLASHQKFLVKKIATSGLRSKFEDALQAGNIGLMIAIKKFEPERGFRLSTYANWWIRTGLSEVYQKPMVNMLTTLERRKVQNNLNRALNYVTKGRPPTQGDFERIADLMNVNVKDVIDMYPIVTQGDFELDAPIKSGESDGNQTLRVDMLADPTLSPEDVVIQLDEVESARARIAEAMTLLNERQKIVFQGRRLDDPKRSLGELASVFNISRERVRQIEVKAFDIVQAYVRDGVVRKPGNGGRGRPRKKPALDEPSLDVPG